MVTFRTFEIESRKTKVFLNPEHKNYARWEPLLKEGAVVRNLIWKDREEGVIDGDSPVEEV